MNALLIFSLTLLAAVLVSDLARRSILSTTVIFLVVGFVAGGLLNVIDVSPTDGRLRLLATLALFSVLFTDGMRINLDEIRNAWRLPGRALLLGLPLTLLLTAVLAHLLVGLPWDEAVLLGAVLSPTDPVLAAAIVGRDEVPRRLRRLLNVESGLNDGLALPFVLILLAVVSSEVVRPEVIAGDIFLGLFIGAAIPVVAIWLERLPFFTTASRYQPFTALSVALLILATTQITGANSYLAAFVGGAVLANVGQETSEHFERLGESVTELLKLAAVLFFGALISPSFLAGVSLSGYVFAVLALLLVRPLALGVSLFRGLPLQEWIAAAWFGPKGFAAVVFALVVVVEGVREAGLLFHLAALVVALSIVIHSSTDVLVARHFEMEGHELAELENT